MKYVLLVSLLSLCACSLSPNEIREKADPVYEKSFNGDYQKSAECILHESDSIDSGSNMRLFASEKQAEIINSEQGDTRWIYDIKQNDTMTDIKLWINPYIVMGSLLTPSKQTLKTFIDQCASRQSK